MGAPKQRGALKRCLICLTYRYGSGLHNCTNEPFDILSRAVNREEIETVFFMGPLHKESPAWQNFRPYIVILRLHYKSIINFGQNFQFGFKIEVQSPPRLSTPRRTREYLKKMHVIDGSLKFSKLISNGKFWNFAL